jgi:hypothetical protein
VEYLSEAAAIRATHRAVRRGKSLFVGRVRVDDVPWSRRTDG